MLHQIRYDYVISKKGNCIPFDPKWSWHQEYTSHMIYDAFLVEKNAKYSKKRGAFCFFASKTDLPHCCRHKKSCEWYILEAKVILHHMSHNFLFWKLCNHILSDAGLCWHQEYTGHMISGSFVIEILSHTKVRKLSHRVESQNMVTELSHCKVTGHGHRAGSQGRV